MAIVRPFLSIVLALQAFFMAWILVGLAIFMPAVSGDGFVKVAWFVLAVFYFCSLIAARKGLKRQTSGADLFAALMTTPLIAYYGYNHIMLQQAYRTPPQAAYAGPSR